MLVSHLLHQFYLPLHTFPPIWIHELVLFIDLHGNLLVTWLVKTYPNDGVGTLADLLTDDILIQVILITEDHTVFVRIATLLVRSRRFCWLCWFFLILRFSFCTLTVVALDCFFEGILVLLLIMLSLSLPLCKLRVLYLSL